jgi:hypothetical protein
LKVTLTISNNSGYGLAGFYCDSNPSKVEPVTYTSGVDAGDRVTVYGAAASGLSYYDAYNPTTGRMAFGCYGNGVTNNSNDDDIVTYYLKPKANVDITNESIENLIYAPGVNSLKKANGTVLSYSLPTTFTYTESSISYSYVLGDLDGNGEVTVEDAQLLDLLVDTYGPVIAIDATDTGLTYSSTTPYQGLFISIDGVETLVLCVADVNFDGVVDGTDQHLVLVYYVNVIVSGQSYSGEIGETQTKVTYVIDFP